jgi:quercetin dioxygenase-like cupin family protein
MAEKSDLPTGEALELSGLVSYTESGIASRVILRSRGGNVTLFSFDAGQELSEHTAPFDALVMVLEGALTLTVGGTPVRAIAGSAVRLPANVPHAIESPARSKMVLVMLGGRSP